ncbi:Uncharacterized protein PECH_002366 [Penicillium ucsense]|uniref:Glutathione S-transferase kappa n=1 Tax=Penicillium ucsense TaxID=2839758 RepID=A0A8J8W5E4_9EURO|nr:Uncharacterized protein PECM_002996 [Penicillium ucsense]KAF7737906.1 Uncharacterized protein PECH_002366 [Penicillium ucsense]
MSTPKVTLYFDIVSPFAYIAFHVLQHSPTFSKCEVTYVPILLGGLFQLCGNQPPLNVKNKNKWINNERNRWAKRFSVPICATPPPGFPQSTVTVQRALSVVAHKTPEKLPAAIEALYHSFWVQSNSEIGKVEGFKPVLEGVLGEQGTREVLEAITQAEMKALLPANTQRAFDAGAFGLPWFECTNAAGEQQCYWGVDNLEDVAGFLGLQRGRDPKPLL